MEWRAKRFYLFAGIPKPSIPTVFIAFYLQCLVLVCQGQPSSHVPQRVSIAMLSNVDSKIIDATLNFTVSAIKQDPSLLPNTDLNVKRASTQAAYQLVNDLQAEDVAVVIEMPGSPLKSELIADFLNATSIKTGIFDCDPLYQADDFTMCEYTATLQQSLSVVNDALIQFVKQTKISQIIILYDAFRAKQVSHFVQQGEKVVEKYVLVYLNFDKSGQLNPHTLNDLKNVYKNGIHNFVAFSDPQQYEVLIDVINLYMPSGGDEGSTWLLPLLPGELTITAGPLDKIVGFRLAVDEQRVTPLVRYLRMHADFCQDGVPDSLTLLHDSLRLVSTAIHRVISDGQWNVTSKKGLTASGNKTMNAFRVTKMLSNVSLEGISGHIHLTDQGYRNHTYLDLLILRKNVFMKIGNYSTGYGLNINSNITKNRDLPTFRTEARIIRAVAMQQQPFVLVHPITNTTYSYSGFSYDVLKKLCEDLNLQFKISLVKENNMDALIDKLTNGEADIVLNPVIVSAKRQRSVVFTKPLMHFQVALMIRQKQKGELDLTQFMLPFTVPAWCLLLASWFVVTIIVHFLDRFSPYGWRQKQRRVGEKGDEFSLFNSLWFCLACILTQGADHTPRNLSGRVLACCFWFCILIWNATYTANLASFLTLKDTSLPVSSLDDAWAQGYKITVIKDSTIAHILNISTVDIHRTVWNDIKSTSFFSKDHDEGAQRCRDGKVGFIAEKPFLEYTAGRKPCELALISNVLQPMSFAFALPLNSKFVDSLSVGILKLQEKGVTESFERKWWEYRNQCPKTQQEVSQSRLDIQEMLGVYLVLAVGIVLSLMAVAGEVWWKNGLGQRIRRCFGTRRKTSQAQETKEAEATK